MVKHNIISGIINHGIAKQIVIINEKRRSNERIASLYDSCNELSIVFISFENLAITLPIGVESKNDIGEYNIFFNKYG